MDPLVIPPETKPEMERFYRQLFDGAQGTIIELSQAPTSTDDPKLLSGNQMGFYNNKIYVNFNGTVYEFAVTAVT